MEKEIRAMSYENFIKRGLRFDKRSRRPHKSELANLIDFENGVRHKFLPNGEKQLSELKARLTKAIKLMVTNLDLDEAKEKELTELLSDIEKASSSLDISNIVELGMDLTHEHR